MPISIPELEALAEALGPGAQRIFEIMRPDYEMAQRVRAKWRHDKQRRKNSTGIPPERRPEFRVRDKERKKELLPFSDPSDLRKEAIAHPVSKSNWPSDYREQFWAVYPLRVGKRKAMLTLQAIRSRGEVEWAALIEGTNRYARDPNREQGFTKHPTTWLNAGCWDDEPIPARANGGPNGKAQRPADDWVKGARFKIVGGNLGKTHEP